MDFLFFGSNIHIYTRFRKLFIVKNPNGNHFISKFATFIRFGLNNKLVKSH